MTADKKTQIRHGFVYLFTGAVAKIWPFITIPIFTRILSREDYGVLALAYVYASFATGLSHFGMTAAYERNYFQYRHDRLRSAQLFYSLQTFSVLNFFLLAAITYRFHRAISLFLFHAAEHGPIVFWAFCAMFVHSLIERYFLTYFKNMESPREFSIYRIAEGFVGFVVSLVLVVALRMGVAGIVYAQLFAGILIVSVLMVRFLRLLPIAMNWRIFVASFRLAYPLTPRIFLGVLNTQTDKYMIGLLASVGGVGIYSIGQKLAHVIDDFTSAIQNVFQPQVYRKMFDLGEEGKLAIGRYLTPVAYVSIAIAFLAGLFSEEVISILTPPDYHASIDITIILSMYYGILFFAKINGAQLLFMKKTPVTSLLTVIRMASNVAFNIYFVMRWGAIGAAFATLLAGVLAGCVSFVSAQKFYRIAWEYKWMIVNLTLFYGCMSLLLLLRMNDVPYPIRLLCKCISLALYVYVGVKITLVSRQNFQILKDILVSKWHAVTGAGG